MRVVILASGCFDGLHAGHVRYLQAARALAGPSEPLCVAIAPDAYILAAKKRYPQWTQRERAQVVCALACVDDVLLQETDSAAAVITRCAPRVFVKGYDWIGRLPTDVVAACHKAGAEIVFTQTPGRHTSEVSR